MAQRANWKGYLRLGALSCPVALYTAASAAERVTFNTVNRATGNRVKREFIDEQTGKPVERENQIKGYEQGDENYVLLEQEEIDKAVPEASKTFDIEAFVPADGMDRVFFDQPYYLAPYDKVGEEVFALLRAAMEQEKVEALARTVIFRRERLFHFKPEGKGLLGHSLHFDYEIRPAAQAFDDVPKVKITAEMRDLAKHIIKSKRGTFDPKGFDDRYDAALVDVIRAKQAGKAIKRKAPAAASGNVVSLLDALRQSAGGGAGKAESKKAPVKRKVAAKKASKTVKKTRKAA